MRKILTLALFATVAVLAVPRGGHAQAFTDASGAPPLQTQFEKPRREFGPPPEVVGSGYGRVRFGTICVTSRGQCSVGRPLPMSSGCSCFIPGFGQKRGGVQF